MQAINQDQAPVNIKAPSKSENNSKSDFFDDYSTSMYSSGNSGSKQDFGEAMMMGFEPIDSKESVHSMFSPIEKEQPRQNAVADRQPSSSYGRNSRERESKSSATSLANSYDTDLIQKKEMTSHRSNDRQIFQSSNVRLQSHQLITLEMDHNKTLQEVSSMECVYLERLLNFFLFRGWQRKRWESLRISQSRLRPRRY